MITHILFLSSVVYVGKKYDVILFSPLTGILSENIISMVTEEVTFPSNGWYSAHVTCVTPQARLTFLGGEGHAMSLVPTASGTRLELWYNACSWEQ